MPPIRSATRCNFLVVREDDREAEQPRGSLGRRLRAARLPRVAAEVVVVAAGAEEGGLVAGLRGQPHPELVAVEADRLVDVADGEVDVADRRAVRQPVELGVARLGEQRVGVERERRHRLRDPALPLLARAVGVDLDAVVVRVAEVDRLAHDVVGEAGERDPLAPGVGEEAAEARAIRDEQRDVEEAGETGGRARARLLDEAQERRVGAELGRAVLA